jgi:hypothetical protein
MPEEYDPPVFYVAITRVISGLVLQLILAREFHEGLMKMKFALNHEWKFENPYLAFTAGFFQTSAIITVTAVNYYAIF